MTDYLTLSDQLFTCSAFSTLKKNFFFPKTMNNFSWCIFTFLRLHTTRVDPSWFNFFPFSVPSFFSGNVWRGRFFVNEFLWTWRKRERNSHGWENLETCHLHKTNVSRFMTEGRVGGLSAFNCRHDISSHFILEVIFGRVGEIFVVFEQKMLENL